LRDTVPGPGPTIGFDVGGQSVKAVLVDADGTVLGDCSRPSGEATTIGDLAAVLAALRQELLAFSPLPLPAAPSYGLGIAGVMSADGVLQGSPNLPQLVGARVGEVVADVLGVSVVVDNDAHCAALAEGWNGAAAGEKDFLLVTLGSGVGSGLILDHEVFHGSTGHGCELGHAVLVAGGRRCGCGNLGCLEAYVSEVAARGLVEEAAGALLAAVEARVTTGVGYAQSVFRLAGEGSAEAETIAAGMIRSLGVGLASAVNVFDVTLVVIGGGIAPSVIARLDELQRWLAHSLFARSIDAVSIRAAVHGHLAGAIGAARMGRARVDSPKPPE